MADTHYLAPDAPALSSTELDQSLQQAFTFNFLWPFEDPQQLEALRRTIYNDFQSNGPERIFLEDMVGAQWRYRRLHRVEHTALTVNLQELQQNLQPGEPYDFRVQLAKAWDRVMDLHKSLRIPQRQNNYKQLFTTCRDVVADARQRRPKSPARPPAPPPALSPSV